MEILIERLSEEGNFTRLMEFIFDSERSIVSCETGGPGDCGSCQGG